MFSRQIRCVARSGLSLLGKQNSMRNTILAASTRSFHSSQASNKVDVPAEERCRELLSTLPNYEYIFQNEDGSKRTPSDEELKTIAFLNTYADERKLNWLEIFTYPRQYKDLYLENDKDLGRLKASSGLIIDKIPYEDTATGEIKWKIVRDNEGTEGWENIAHFLFVPAFCLLAATLFWRDDMDVTEWAKRELLYRVKEKAVEEGDTAVLDAFKKHGDKPEAYEFDLAGFDKNDDVIVERILSGEYDKMAKLKVKQQQQQQ
ncbi:DEKNAAC102987 [Brettanomyces naardenensis]|uniref:DEKNAAC102987 n=1 Tax=Brettanomyces naardenensis TaxID=13370 RepID=A0A448YLZ6_BRENA|nr:DEKNAAC102987 [Brettanomyces naardenensis]